MHQVTENELDMLQEKVDLSVRSLGGYWRPLSGLARVIEEVGEVADLLQVSIQGGEQKQRLQEELADLLVISTSIANQYCVVLADEFKKLGYIYQTGEKSTDHTGDNRGEEKGSQKSEATDQTVSYQDVSDQKVSTLVYQLVTQSGKMARILNHYEGDKKKKKTERHTSLAEQIAHFQWLTFQIAHKFDVTLFQTVHDVMDHNVVRDQGRFALTFDPSTEPIVEKLQREVVNRVEVDHTDGLPWAFRKLWGVTLTEQVPEQENAFRLQETFRRLMTCGEAEGIAGVVVEKKADCAWLRWIEAEETYMGISFRVLKYELEDEQTPVVIFQPQFSVNQYGDIFAYLLSNMSPNF